MLPDSSWTIILLITTLKSIEGNIFRIIKNESIPCIELQKKPYNKIAMTEQELLEVFHSQGGTYVREYMAPDQETASTQFKDLLTISKEIQDQRKRTHYYKYRDNLYTKSRLINDMQRFFALIKNKTREAQAKRTKMSSRTANRRRSVRSRDYTVDVHRDAELQNYFHSYATDGIPYTQPDLIGVRSKRQTTTESTEIEYCLARGTDVDGYLNMCTTCAASTTLAEDKFPRMLNEVICDQKDQGCFTVNGTPHGSCRQKYIYMNLLERKEGYCQLALKDDSVVIVDDWQLYTQPIRVSCECYFNSQSVFAAYVKGN